MNPIVEAFYIAYLGDARLYAETDEELYWMASNIHKPEIRQKLIEKLKNDK